MEREVLDQVVNIQDGTST